MDQTPRSLPHEDLTRIIIGAFYYVYNTLGCGFLESVYTAALVEVLTSRGYRVRTEVWVPIWFEGKMIARHRLDMLVEETIIVEVKACESLHERATRQLTNYLAATRLDVGLILHFGPTGAKPYRRDRIKRSS